ncbi:YybH family protein [Halobacillus salinus]|uniref:DUF4440 domain-containing protein n=1 Tax=Halobacillus salinus TaxID=192814 RepID=A0A4Z0GVA0_9BACI|nr:nuclear transport factor 2 family protein [Halobacillus salinus]TGB00766.1 DUF4440 domain-containing protein [Halobacillus salinus]
MTSGISTAQEVLETYKQAVKEKDVEKLMSAYSPEIHIYDAWGNWELDGKAAWRDNVIGWFDGLNEEGVFLQVDLNDLVVEEGDDTAFAHCAVTYAAHKNETEEKLRQMSNRFTFCMKKVDGSWMITHEHSSLPINTENGKGMFHLR